MVKWFWPGAKEPVQAIREEIDALNGHIEDLTAQLADIEQKLRQARENEQRSFAANAIDDAVIAAVSVKEPEPQCQGVQKTMADLRRRPQEAEQQFGMVQEAIAAARTKVSHKNVSAIEVCAGEVRWHNGLLEQLWHIYYFGPTGAVEKTAEDWQLVPVSEEPALAGHIRYRPTLAGTN